MDDEEKESKKGSLGSSVAAGFTAAATGYADYKKNKAEASKKDASKTLSSAEKSASKTPSLGGSKNPLSSARSAESAPLFTGKGKAANAAMNSNPKSKAIGSAAKALPLLLIGGLILGVMSLIFILQPIMKLGTIIHNLSTALGFDHIVAILEEKSTYAAQELLSNGEVNENLYARLLENNIEVGQVTASGDFVKTNTYLAYLDEDIASTDDNYQSDKKGALSIRFNNKIIEACDFVAAVESDPALYAEVSKALNVSANYYYSDEVEGIYSQLGITRNEFSDYEETDDDKENYENFSNLVSSFLDNGKGTTIEVISSDCRGKRTISTGSGSGGSGSNLTSQVDDATHDYDLEIVGYDDKGNPIYECLIQEETARQDEASALLSTALSSLEPYEATKAFMVITEPIQQVQAGDNGPINQLMNMLDVSTSVSYKDIKTGQSVETTESIMTNSNFLATITFGDYDTDEAYNFSRDRTLITTNAGTLDTLQKTNTATPKQQAASSNSFYSYSSNNLSGANEVFDSSLYTNRSETFTSTIGANNVVEGGAFLNDTINSVVGALASDSTAVAKYQKEANEVFARQAEAERATKSPFDITSKNTFLGSIVYNFATAMTYYSSKSSSNAAILTIPESIASVTKNSIASITGLVSADNYEDGYLGTNGTDCLTLDKMEYGLVGDIYCSEHKTVDVEKISWTLSDFLGSEIGSQIDSSTGEITNKYGSIMETLVLGADRNTSVGVGNSEICSRASDFGNFWSRIYRKVTKLFGVECADKDQTIATGTKYTLSDSNTDNLETTKLVSAYALYQMARKIVGEENEVSIARAQYYEEHPLDNSEAGYIARISGMTKEEAEIALAYADYLVYLAKYDPSTRYSFINPANLVSSPLSSLEFNEELSNVYALVSKELTYADIRNRLVSMS